MTQHNVTDSEEPVTAAVHVPLSERPLVADDENTVITVPEQARNEVRTETSPVGDAYRQRLFPASGNSGGEEAGIRLAHFEITSRLGSGGMGAVFKATDLELARDVALKILHPSSSQDASLIARFRNEARACAQLNHDNIARVFYAGTQEGLYFIAYEYASGSTIRDLIIDRGCLSIEDTVNYAIQVTLALNHIAAAGIVHRDIKPSNIMLTTSGRVKVVDLGLARRDTTDSIGDITVAGTTLGTFDYISPEQARDPRNADIRSDIYSLGCTMYHMLTGQPPYPEGTALQKLLDHQGKSPPDPCLINASVPAALAGIMRKMMSNSPDHRYAAPGLLLNDLIQMAAMVGLHSVPAEGIVWRKLNPSAHRQPLGAVWVFASVLLICVTAFLLQRSARQNTSSQEMAGVDAEAQWKGVDPTRFEANAALKENSSVAVVNPVGVDARNPEGLTPSGTSVPVNATSPPLQGVSPAVTSPQAVPTTTASPTLALIPNGGMITPSLIDWLLSKPQPGLAPVAAEDQMGPFVLQSSDGRFQPFRTLKAAVADAQSGDVVLLRYNGYPQDLPAQPPVRIVGINLIIRAADGFRPTLEFEGVSEGAVSPGQMFNLRNQGSLTMRDIDLRLIVRDDITADRWSLFHCVGPNRVLLENVSIECQNIEGQPTALFDLSDESTGPVDLLQESEYSLSRVICRADADCFRVACQPHGRIRIENCGLALNGTLLQLRGDSSMQSSRGSLDVFLDHVTCVHSESLIHMRDSDERKGSGTQRTLPRLSIRSEASVFAGTGRESRLLYSEGNSYVEDIESLVTWNGFTNLYDGHDVFWQIETSALDYSVRRLDFLQWKQLWQTRPDSEDTNSELLPSSAWRNPVWKKTADLFTLSDVTPSVFELDRSMFIRGIQSLPQARDGLMPGVNAQELPRFPEAPKSELPINATALKGQAPVAVPIRNPEAPAVDAGTLNNAAATLPSYP